MDINGCKMVLKKGESLWQVTEHDRTKQVKSM